MLVVVGGLSAAVAAVGRRVRSIAGKLVARRLLGSIVAGRRTFVAGCVLRRGLCSVVVWLRWCRRCFEFPWRRWASCFA